MKTKIKQMVLKFSALFNHLPFNNKIRARGAKIQVNKTLLRHCKIDCKGDDNIVIFHSGGVHTNCSIFIRGNHNRIEIGSDVSSYNCKFWVEDSGNTITIGNNTKLCGKTHLACIEGTTITIGERCLFSSDIVFRTGDSHSLTDLLGKRINPSANIVIGNHVWIGHHVMVNKGVRISSDSMVGTGSILTKSIDETNVVIAGVPGKVVKKGTNWLTERIACEKYHN